MTANPYVLWFEDEAACSVELVGGKNASLAEMTRTMAGQGIRVPAGFAITVAAYRDFLDANGLREPIRQRLDAFDAGRISLEQAGSEIRKLVLAARLPQPVVDAVREAYGALCQHYDDQSLAVAVRSSATAEDLPGASFAGQHESFLNITGADAVAATTVRCFASLFKDRAITYRREQGFEDDKVLLSVGVQKMVRSDKGGAGVMFSIDTETGFPRAVVIDAAWGLGESVVQGSVTPDQYLVFKPFVSDPALVPILEKTIGAKETKVVYSAGGGTETVPTTEAERRAFVLNEAEIQRLARWAVDLEKHYGVPMDMEWAKDGDDGLIYMVQARPETVQSRREAASLKT